MLIKRDANKVSLCHAKRCLAAAETLGTIYYMTACLRGHGDRRCAVIHRHVIRLQRAAEEGQKYITPRLLPQVESVEFEQNSAHMAPKLLTETKQTKKYICSESN